MIEQHIYDELCEEIKNSLIACGYSDVEEVSIDVKSQDIVIDGFIDCQMERDIERFSMQFLALL